MVEPFAQTMTKCDEKNSFFDEKRRPVFKFVIVMIPEDSLAPMRHVVDASRTFSIRVKQSLTKTAKPFRQTKGVKSNDFDQKNVNFSH